MEAARHLNELDTRTLTKANLFCEVADLNGSSLTIDDLADLLSMEADAPGLRALLEGSQSETGYRIISGYILKEGSRLGPEDMLRRRGVAAEYISSALKVSRFIRGGDARLVAISGSTAYGSVGPLDDLDFFCVTSEHCAWLFITRSLLLLRIMRVFSSGFERVCLSCVMDEGYAESVFGKPQGALFSRDALTTIVLSGGGVYSKLLQMGIWMRDYFPRIYDRRTASAATPVDGPRASLVKRLLNSYLYHTVGRYIMLKSYIKNRKLALSGSRGMTFAARMGEDHCIFESERYLRMKRMYDSAYEGGTRAVAEA